MLKLKPRVSLSKLSAVIAIAVSGVGLAPLSLADITVYSDDSATYAAETEAALEANGGVVTDDFSIFPYPVPGGVQPAQRSLIVDDLVNDDGIAHLQVGAALRLGPSQGLREVDVRGAGARLTAQQDIALNEGSSLRAVDGEILSYGAVEQQLGSHGSIVVSGGTGKLTSVATAAHPQGGRMAFRGASDDPSGERALLVADGGQVSALSEVGTASGAGRISFEGEEVLVRASGPGSRIAAQYGIDVRAGLLASITIFEGAELVQLEANGSGRGISIGSSGPAMGYVDLFIQGEGAAVRAVEDIHLAPADLGPSNVVVSPRSGGRLETAGRVLLGAPTDPQAGDAPDERTAHLQLADGGIVTAQKTVVNSGSSIYGDSFVDPSLENTVNGDVQVIDSGRLEGSLRVNGNVQLSDGGIIAPSVSINGDLDARNGTVELRSTWLNSPIEVAGTALFGEGSLLRILIDAVPAGGEVLIDRYLMADRYEFSPEFQLASQLEVVMGPEVAMNAGPLTFRFQAAGQEYRYGVPELDGRGSALALGLLLAVASWRRERRRLPPRGK